MNFILLYFFSAIVTWLTIALKNIINSDSTWSYISNQKSIKVAIEDVKVTNERDEKGTVVTYV